MDDVIELYKELRSIAKEKGDEVAKEFSVATDEDPAGFFGMAFNDVTMALELLSFYASIWTKNSNSPISDVKVAGKQNRQRIMLVQKMTFIEIMSSFEFSAKKIALINPQNFGELPEPLYLSFIMDRSLEKNFIDSPSRNLWTGVIRLRNSLVHNNGISFETATYNYPEVTINVNEGRMTQGNLKLYGLLTKWLLNESRTWTSSVHTASMPHNAR